MFPKNLTVSVRAYSSTVSEFGEPVEELALPVDVLVYGFGDSGADQEIRTTATGLKIDGDIYADAWAFAPKSRVTVAGAEYWQVGWPENYNLGPFGFMPGVRVNLARIEG